MGRLGPHDAADRRVGAKRSPSASWPSCGRRCACARSATCRSASSSPAGIDSSTNAALFSEGEEEPVKTFSIGYEGEYESYQNELALRATDGRATSAPSTTSVMLDSDDLSTSCRGWSTCRTSRSPTRCACRCTTSRSWRATTASSWPGRRGRRRAVLGLSGVEDSRCSLQRWDDLPVPRWLRRAPGWRLLRAPAADKACALRVAAARRSRPAGLLGRRRGVHAETEAASAVAPPARASSRGLSSWEALAADPRALRQRRRGSQSHLNWMTYLDLQPAAARAAADAGRQDEMGVSLEGRVPFLDHKFVEPRAEHPAEA